MPRGEKIERLIRWVERDQWQNDVGEVIQQHPGEACAPPGMRGDEELADFEFTRLGRNSVSPITTTDACHRAMAPADAPRRTPRSGALPPRSGPLGAALPPAVDFTSFSDILRNQRLASA